MDNNNNPNNKPKNKTDGFTWLIIFIPSIAYYFHRIAGDFFLDRYPILADTVTVIHEHKHTSSTSSHVKVLEDALYFLEDGNSDYSNHKNIKLKHGVEILWDHSSNKQIQNDEQHDSTQIQSHLNGPTWVHDEELGRGYLLYSDTAANRIWRWEVGGGPIAIGRTLYMERSGCRSNRTLCEGNKLPGTTSAMVEIGLVKDAAAANLVLAEQGERRIIRLEEDGARTPLATHVNVTALHSNEQQKMQIQKSVRLNGPYDLAYSPFGDLVFTDPIRRASPSDYTNLTPLPAGVWRVPEAALIPPIPAAESRAAHFTEVAEHTMELLYSKLSIPSGVAFSHDLQSVYVSNGDADDMVIVKLPISKLDDSDKEDEEMLMPRRRLLAASDEDMDYFLDDSILDDVVDYDVNDDGEIHLLEDIEDVEEDDLDEYIRKLEEELIKLESVSDDEYDMNIDGGIEDIDDNVGLGDDNESSSNYLEESVDVDYNAEGITIASSKDKDDDSSGLDDNQVEKANLENELEFGDEQIDPYFDVKMAGSLDDEKDVLFFNASSLSSISVNTNAAAGLGGLAVDSNGNVWVASPSGIIVVSSEGDHLGTVSLGDDNEIATNVAFGGDGFLYVTTEQKLLRIRTKAKALVVPNMLSKNV